MKHFHPPKALLELDQVIKYDSECVPILSTAERTLIKYKRAKLMAGLDVELTTQLMDKIAATLEQIHKKNWHPENPILYKKHD
ncbi:hypothetical protein B0A58_07300 [Flavobacterium branchiophilum NBRC 15030 = ATCC 35035]|uniref:Uncharacterized protein n=1 Tax=Flavobacterium branchiophilum TaxID=55197 RepID=A0A543G143_9FLAO|nr:hypothetical protein [Flavobacterium branchiophilum]OXA76371.1 hypothetical protein B0A58_07300 [Flavobacterium branchiophilum NBRC 15030 = ATCC 35035]TQM39808.1 hypothetical protein BC670_0640 [Flavobacterium branchiophilum]GEM55270.1 hypothetical protein FB1_14910 [Flavobacterium branchiophilum NBRC 15030 = ATCC 35035]